MEILKETILKIKNYLLVVLGGNFIFLSIIFIGDKKFGLVGLICLILAILSFYFSKDLFYPNIKKFEKLSEIEKNRFLEIRTQLSSVNPKSVKTFTGLFNHKNKLYGLIFSLLDNTSNDEEISYFFIKPATSNMIFITNKKLLLIQNSIKSIQYEKINTVENGKNFLKISTNSETIKIPGLPNNEVTKLANEIRQCMELHKSVNISITKITEKDISNKIARLKSLYDEGILTEYEFNIKKLELLDKAK